MVTVKSFRGTRYNSQLIENLRLVIAPPYDVISEEEQDYYYRLYKYNVIRLILGKEQMGDDEYNNKYTRAAGYLSSWRQEGILIDDVRPSIYLYEQTFKDDEGKERVRLAFFCLVKLEEYNQGNILAHEATKKEPKIDRLNLLRATRANLSPILGLYPDENREVEELLRAEMQKRPREKVVDKDGIQHRIWVVSKKNFIERIQSLMSKRFVLIADGHHRYETALLYRKEMREADGSESRGERPFDYVLMCLTNMDSEGIAILPTHRLLHRDLGRDVNIKDVVEELSNYFDVIKDKVNLNSPKRAEEAIRAKMRDLSKKGPSFAMVSPPNHIYYAILKPEVDPSILVETDVFSPEVKRLDVTLVDYYVISQLWVGNPQVELEDDEKFYTHSIRETLNCIKERKACVAFLLNPPSISDIKRVVKQGELMPPKSTYFYPKVPSGLVMRDMSLER